MTVLVYILGLVYLVEDLGYNIFGDFVAVVGLLLEVDILHHSLDPDVLLVVHTGMMVALETLMHPRAFRNLSSI